MKSKKGWIVVLAVLLIVVAMIVVIVRQTNPAPADAAKEDTADAQTSEAVEAPAETEAPSGTEAPAETAAPAESSEEDAVSGVTVPDGVEVGGDGLD